MKEIGSNISFTKMQASGNDFVVLDNRSESFSKEQIITMAPKICNRKFGVGSDGLLALCAPEFPDVEYTMFYRNSDGSDAGMCGNGARCIALFANSLGFADEHSFSVHEHVYQARVNDEVVIISFPMHTSVKEQRVDGDKLYVIHTGTEHVVKTVEEEALTHKEQLFEEGRRLRYHEQYYPKGTNVNFICGVNNSRLKLQTYERGVENLTLACGTGAIASALVWHHLQKDNDSEQKYAVATEGGTITVHFSYNSTTKQYNNIKLEGPAHFVFKGTFLR